MTTKIMTVGVPYDLFGEKNLKEIKQLLIDQVHHKTAYIEYTDKIVRVAMRLPVDVVDDIRVNADLNFVNNLQYTAAILNMRG